MNRKQPLAFTAKHRSYMMFGRCEAIGEERRSPGTLESIGDGISLGMLGLAGVL